MRTLASIQTVNAVEPIPNADAIEKIRVPGWWVVVKKGEHKTGDKLVYCEIDSLLPERPEFEFLRASSFKPAQTDATGAILLPAGFRIKTVKLRGQVSQGIGFSLSILPADAPTEEGADVTGLLGILKWEPPLPVGMGGKVKGRFPGFLPKTDETRVQVLETVLERHRGKTFSVTEKLDGTSFTAFLRQGEFGICSRNLWMDEADETNVLVRVAKGLCLEEKLRGAQVRLGFDLAVQAEVVGPGIQKNKYAMPAVTLRVFSVLNVDTFRLLDHGAMVARLACVGQPQRRPTSDWDAGSTVGLCCAVGGLFCGRACRAETDRGTRHRPGYPDEAAGLLCLRGVHVRCRADAGRRVQCGPGAVELTGQQSLAD